jgi:tRNA A58 N-methylase Trm61
MAERWILTKAQVNAYSKDSEQAEVAVDSLRQSSDFLPARRSLINVSSNIWEELDDMSPAANDRKAADTFVTDADDPS